MQAPPATLSSTNTTITTLTQSALQLPPDNQTSLQQQLQTNSGNTTQSHQNVSQSNTQVTQNQTVTQASNALAPIPNLTINPNLYPSQQQQQQQTLPNKNDSITQNTNQSVQQQQPSNAGSNVKTSISNNSSNSVMNNINNNTNNSNSSNASTVPLPNPSPSMKGTGNNEPVSLLSSHPQLLPINASHNVGGMIPNMNSLMSAQSQLQQHLNAGQQLSNMLNANVMKQSGSTASGGGSGNQSADGLNPNYMDQIEMSLAQFEAKNELMNNLSHSSLMHDISLLKQDQLSSLQQQHNIMNQMSHSQNLHMHINGFGMDMAMNGLAPSMGNLPMHLNSMVANSQMSQMFDAFNPLPKPPNYNNNPNNNANNANSVHGGSGGGNGNQQAKMKDEKYLGVRPLEDLMMNPNDKKMGNHGHDVNNKMGGFGANNVKNANSWSSLASGSPQSTPKPKPPAMDTFQAFKKQAKEKEARQKLLEQQEIKRVQKEQAEKERQRQQEQIKAKQQQEQAEQAALNNGR